jgi:hypothetical protein
MKIEGRTEADTGVGGTGGELEEEEGHRGNNEGIQME